MVTKKEIRTEVLKRRSTLSTEEVESKSNIIYKEIIGHPWFKDASMLLVYMDFKKEVMTRALIEKAWELGKTVGVPKVIGKTMEYYAITDFDDLEKGTMGIMEPKKECPLIDLSDGQVKSEEVFVIMPGVAFDRERNRIGYGGGYYDRYFADKEHIKKMAVTFEIQLVDHIDTESFDLKPHCLLTEKQLYTPN